MTQRQLTAPFAVLFLLSCSAADSPAAHIRKHEASFLGRLQDLLALSELQPDKVTKSLGITFLSSTKEEVRQPPDCTNTYFDRSRLVANHVAQNSWYTQHAEGKPDVEVPAFMINPAEKLGAPNLIYKTTKAQNCTGDRRPLNYRTASINFSNLPGYACIQSSDVRAFFPDAETIHATEGVTIIIVSAQERATTGIDLMFNFRPGVSCAIGISIEQQPRNTKIYGQSSRRFEQCRLQVHREFCRSHPPFTFGDGGMMDI